MNLKSLTLAALVLSSLAGAVRAEDGAVPSPTPSTTQTGDRQRLRDGFGAGGQLRAGAQSGVARGTCDGSMRRDGSGGGRGRR